MRSWFHLLRLGVAALGMGLLAGVASAAYPNGPVKIIVPSAPGGVTDPIARHIAEYLQRKWNSPVVVEHRPGAGGVTATAMMVKAPADGQTLVMANIGPLVFSPALYNVPYVVSRDIVPVGALVQFANVLLVNPNLPVKSVRDLIALAKSKPGTLNFASSGNGQSQHLTGEMFKRMAGIDIQHVAYKGTGPATTDLIGGQVQIMFGNIPSALPFVKDGKLRAVAVTGPRRSPAFPDVPTIAESGVPGFSVTSHLILVAAAGTPADIVRKINADVNELWAQPASQKILEGLYMDWQKQSPEELAAFLAGESQRWSKLIKEANLKGE